MKIQSSVSFGRRMFDIQAHVGKMYDGVHGNKLFEFTSQSLLDKGPEKFLVSSLTGLSPIGSDLFQSEVDNAKEMAKLKGNDKVKLYPLVSCQPGIASDTTAISEALEKGNFYGMKFHPTNTNKPIRDNFEIYAKYLKLAQEKGLPCVFHSASDGKSNPMDIIRLAETQPKLPVVLYHIDLAAQPEQMSKTIEAVSQSVKSGKSNLFVDISWLTNLWDNAETNKNVLKQALEKLGPSRILFGSDAPIAEMGDKQKYTQFVSFIEQTATEFYHGTDAEKPLNKIFYDNAEELFIQKTWFEKLEHHTQKTSKGMYALGATLIIGTAALAIKHFNCKNKH